MADPKLNNEVSQTTLTDTEISMIQFNRIYRNYRGRLINIEGGPDFKREDEFPGKKALHDRHKKAKDLFLVSGFLSGASYPEIPNQNAIIEKSPNAIVVDESKTAVDIAERSLSFLLKWRENCKGWERVAYLDFSGQEIKSMDAINAGVEVIKDILEKCKDEKAKEKILGQLQTLS